MPFNVSHHKLSTCVCVCFFRRKASVDKNYEWDSTDVSIQPGDQDLEGTSERAIMFLFRLACHCL